MQKSCISDLTGFATLASATTQVACTMPSCLGPGAVQCVVEAYLACCQQQSKPYQLHSKQADNSRRGLPLVSVNAGGQQLQPPEMYHNHIGKLKLLIIARGVCTDVYMSTVH